MGRPGRREPSTIPDRVRLALVSRRLPAVVAVIAMVLTVPSLWQGWLADDLIHRDILLTSSLPAALRGLFVFADPVRRPQFMDSGGAPWWTLDTLRISFFRPLAALTHWIDYRAWPGSGVLMHAHSILWYGSVCALAAEVYRRLMGYTWVAGLAAFIFAVDVVHLGSVGWLANRNGLMAVFFGLLTLLAHDRWRRDGWRPGAALAPFWLALALLSAEAGVATGAYLCAYALFLDRGAWRRRLGSLLPHGAVAATWQALYHWLGYGARGSGFYVDPARDPARFVAAVFDRGPVLLLSQWTGQVPLLYNGLSISTRRFVWLIAVLFLAWVGVVMAPVIQRDRVARFWTLGMALAVVPACSISLLSGRLLLFTGLGAMGLMAQLIAGLVDRREWLPHRAAWRVPAWLLCVLLIGLHVLLAPALMPVLASTPDVAQAMIARVTEIGPIAAGGRQDVVIVNAPSPFHFIYVPSLRHFQDRPTLAGIRVLAPGYASVEVRRLDDDTLLVRPEHGYLVPPGTGLDGRRFDVVYIYQQLDQFFRSSAFAMAFGEQIVLRGVRVEVAALTEDGRPAAALVRFGRSLEDPALVWVRWDWATGAYVPFVPPVIGRTVLIPGPIQPSVRVRQPGLG
jgi:hypothetical protein